MKINTLAAHPTPSIISLSPQNNKSPGGARPGLQ